MVGWSVRVWGWCGAGWVGEWSGWGVPGQEKNIAHMLPPACFGADEPSQVLDRILQEGAWARCCACQEVANTKRAAQGLLPSASLEHAFAGADDINCGEPVYSCGICNLNKRAARFAPSMVNNARRNNTMVCNECTAKQCKKCGTLMHRRHLKDGVICRT